MDAPKIIMAPTDLSNRSEVAVDYAATLAEKFGADLVLFTNVNGPEEEELADYGRVEGLTIGDAAQAALKLSAHTNAPGSEVARIVAFEAPGANTMAGCFVNSKFWAIVMRFSSIKSNFSLQQNPAKESEKSGFDATSLGIDQSNCRICFFMSYFSHVLSRALR